MNALNNNVTPPTVATVNSADETPVPPSNPAPPLAASGKHDIAKLAVGFISKFNDKDLVVITSSVLNALDNNPHYAKPVPTLAQVSAARDALQAAVNDASGSKLALAIRRQLRPPLAALLRELAQYVQTTSKGNRVVLTSSGFPLQRSRQPAGVLPAPANLRLSRGKLSGQLRARCKVVAKAAAYQWRIGPVLSPGVWLAADPTMSAHATLTGLSPGTQYVVQVRAIGSQGPGDWSDAAIQIAM